jgi:hypothetical protein
MKKSKQGSAEKQEQAAVLERLKQQIANTAAKILGIASPERAMHLVTQQAASVHGFEGDDNDPLKRFEVAVNAIADFKPRDETERLLVTQMLSVHEDSMKCFRMAMHPEQCLEGFDTILKHAEKLVGIYTRQMEALDKHRGKGKQKITVEHVTVQAGGQAIVGDVHAGQGKKAADSKQAKADMLPALTDQSDFDSEGRLIMKGLGDQKVSVRRDKER